MLSASKIQIFSGSIENRNLSTVDNSEHNKNLRIGENRTYILTYGGLLVAATIATIYRTFAFFSFCLSASIALHNDLFASIMRAKMMFFDLNPSGRILNRFSKDLLNIDTKLAVALIEFIIVSG